MNVDELRKECDLYLYLYLSLNEEDGISLYGNAHNWKQSSLN